MEKYYIRNEGLIGNAIIWWKKGGGYTSDVREAEKFTEVEARDICKRHEDSAYDCEYIDGLEIARKMIVDSHYVRSEKRLFVL